MMSLNGYAVILRSQHHQQSAVMGVIAQIGVSYMPMVSTSYWPPLVEMSFVTFRRPRR